MKHSELPWSASANWVVKGGYLIAECKRYIGYDEKGAQVKAYCVANAEFIVRAVNNHDRLVDAVRKLILEVSSFDGDAIYNVKTVADARALLTELDKDK